MPPTRARTEPNQTEDGFVHVGPALNGLRDEWRAGCTGSQIESEVLPALRRLLASTPPAGLAAAINGIVQRFESYGRLGPDDRKSLLRAIAEELKSLEPGLAAAAQPGRAMGKNPSAIAPGRAGSPSRPVPRAAASAGVRLNLETPIELLPGVGGSRQKLLDKLGIGTVGDLLRLSPRRYLDYSAAFPIGRLGRAYVDGIRDVTLTGELTEVKEVFGGRKRTTARLTDGTGSVRITWFSTYVAKSLSVGDRIAVSGPIDFSHGAPSLTNPEWEKLDGPGLSTGRIVPIYPLTKGITQKTLRTFTRTALDRTSGTIIDDLPDWICRENRLLPLGEAFERLHYPPAQRDADEARRRLAFDTLLLLQIGLTMRKRARAKSVAEPMEPADDAVAAFHAGLPFALTDAQQRAISEICGDLIQPRPMARLLQGDVGSGKTVVAATAALVAVANQRQVAVLAPTEILAEQHGKNFETLYGGISNGRPPRVALLTGSTPAKARREILARLALGEIDVLVGTHALIQPDVHFAALGLVIIDEQHRFGVAQRAHLSEANRRMQPHILSMTATPIPRTLNLVLNGDLDVSIINELPPGRIPIDTRRYLGSERNLAYQLVRDEIAKGHQAFVICPLVEESDQSEAKAAVAEAERLQNEVFPQLRVAVLHGRMAGREKDRIMTAFRDREFDILVSTSVIEVGIDIPNATVMMIEGANMFGLAQLHQFRGRVGRGGNRSYCLLLADDASANGDARLDLMVSTNDGFVLAEEDLRLRGPGDFIGTRQSGLPEMTFIDGALDARLLDAARVAAEQLLARDPLLSRPEHLPLHQRAELFWASAGAGNPINPS